ncbi:MAG: enoyl-CoA hydratase/isomerase family protein [Spongiibacteraceae bacterium]
MTDTVTTDILLSRDEGVATLTLNRPEKMNTVTRIMGEQLYALLLELNKDRSCRAIVITGAGGNFCTGGDFSDNESKIENPVEGRVRLLQSAHLIELLVNGPKPVIAAVDGYAYGMGMSLALACDYIIATDKTVFNAAFSRLGLAAELGLTWTLPRRIGVGKTKQLLMLSKKVTGADALAMQMVDELCPSATLAAVALERAREFAAAAPLVVAYTKSALAKGHATVESAMATEHEYQAALYMTHDHVEGVKAMFKKRKPEFNGN